MAIVEKTFYTPYVTVYNNEDPAAVSGVVVDSIQVVSDDIADEVEIAVTPLGSDEVTMDISSGDTIHGPFSAYNIGSVSSTEWVIVHERSKIITN